MMDNLWLDIRNSAGHLLFRYNPFTNEIEIRKGGYVYDLVRLDEIRARYNIVELVPGNTKLDVITVSSRKDGS
jgi:hypothetical protein